MIISRPPSDRQIHIIAQKNKISLTIRLVEVFRSEEGRRQASGAVGSPDNDVQGKIR